MNLHLEPNFYESVSITPNPSLFLLYYFVFASPRLKCPSGQKSKTFEISFNPAPSLFFLFYYLLVFPTSGFRKIQMFTHLYQLINWPSISLAEYKVSSPLKRDYSQQQIGQNKRNFSKINKCKIQILHLKKTASITRSPCISFEDCCQSYY